MMLILKNAQRTVFNNININKKFQKWGSRDHALLCNALEADV